MVTIIVIILIILMTIWLIKERNGFVVLVAKVEQEMSNVNTAKAKYLAVQKKAIGLAGKATSNEGQIYESIRNSAGQISSTTLLSLGQMYPDLKDKFDSAAHLSDSLYTDYRNAQSVLNQAITEYNTAIALFPSSIAAWLFGFEKETLIDQEHLTDSKKLRMEDEMDLSEFT